VCKRLGVTERMVCRWRREYGGLSVDRAERLKEPAGENTRHERLVAEPALGTSILAQAATEDDFASPRRRERSNTGGRSWTCPGCRRAERRA
jgi:hypothetical protein